MSRVLWTLLLKNKVCRKRLLHQQLKMYTQINSGYLSLRQPNFLALTRRLFGAQSKADRLPTLWKTNATALTSAPCCSGRTSQRSWKTNSIPKAWASSSRSGKLNIKKPQSKPVAFCYLSHMCDDNNLIDCRSIKKNLSTR